MSINPLFQSQVLQAWFSPSFPTGGFAFSHGLEALVTQGLVSDFNSFSEWLSQVVQHGTGRNDAIVLKSAYECCDWREVNDIALANCASAGRWLETRHQGTAFAKTVNAIYGLDVPIGEPLAASVAVGLAANQMGFSLPDVASAFLQGFVSNLCFAGVRLVPLGQTQAQQAIAGEFNAINQLVAHLPNLTIDDLGTDLWIADTAALAQEEMETRVFRS